MGRRTLVRGTAALWAAMAVATGGRAAAEEPVALRVENLTVPPSTGPLLGVQVKNLTQSPYEGTLTLAPPEGWQLSPAEREVSLGPGERGRVPFTIVKGLNVAANAYPFTVTATGGEAAVVREQTVFVATAPFFKPTIDGDPAEWDHAVPVAWQTAGRKTTVRTYWSRRQFAVLVEVEEEKLVPPALGGAGEAGQGRGAQFDAVQIAIAPGDAVTATSEDGEAARFEFLLAAGGNDGAGRCFQLAAPGMKLADTANARALGPLAYDDADVAVRRQGQTTYYECSLPFRPMRDEIRPSEGREFRFSVLVHDPDGTGLRDLGAAAGLWPWQRTVWAWSRFEGAVWPEKPPFDSKVEWGMCSSLY
jgi:hypothetical protein